MDDFYYNSDIISYVKSKVKLEDVDDIIQDSIVKYLNVKDKDSIKNKKNYYFFIVKSRIAEYYRKKSIKEKHEIITDEDIILNSSGELELNNYKLLSLRYIYGYSVLEISEMLNISIKNVYRLLNNEKGELLNDLLV